MKHIKSTYLFGISGVFALFLAPMALADVLIELYTAMECPSCRDAEILAAELVEREGVIAIGYHLHYWDYLGEDDALANPVFAARQAGYNLHGEFKEVQTPQFVVQGRALLGLSDGEEMTRSLVEILGEEPVVMTDIVDGDGRLEIALKLAPQAVEILEAEGEDAARFELIHAEFYDGDVVEGVYRAQGLEAPKIHMVERLTSLGVWNGIDEFEVLLEGADAEGVVFLQRQDFGEIVYVQPIHVVMPEG